MTSTHRRWHVRLWIVVAGLIVIGVVLALVLRRGSPVETSAHAATRGPKPDPSHPAATFDNRGPKPDPSHALSILQRTAHGSRLP